jgi:F0F1-type ATP synthase membrane subunit a
MTAGHTLLHMITSFGIIFLNNSSYIVLIFITLLILAIYLLEFGIAFIQAYVFLILISIYLNDSIVGGH